MATCPVAGEPGVRAHRFPILMYHGIDGGRRTSRPARERQYWVPEPRFRAHLAALGPQRFALLRACWEPASLPAAAVVVTFDDGRESDYHFALPALQAHGAPAEFFVNPATVGSAGYVTWAQLRYMARHGMSIQSHGWEHTDLTRLASPELHRQLRRAKEEIEHQLGAEVTTLAVPYGSYNRLVLVAARACGYQLVCTSSVALAAPGAWLLPRLTVYRYTSPRRIQRLAQGGWPARAVRHARSGLMLAPRRLFQLARCSPLLQSPDRGRA